MASMDKKGKTAAKARSKKNAELLQQQSMICENLSFAASEAYKRLRANLQFVLPKDGCRIVGVTSSLRGEGKSTTSINLSFSLAQSGKKVLLVEGDLRLPAVSERLGIEQSPGLSNLLADLCDEHDAIKQSRQMENWYIFPAGDTPPNPSELLGSERMHQLLQHCAKLFDYIVVDLPPIGIVSDALSISPWMDGLMVVVRQNYTSQRALNDIMYQIQNFGVRFLGFIMTDAAVGEGAYKSGGRYGKYGKYGKYGEKTGYGYGSTNQSSPSDEAFKAVVSSEEKASTDT